MFGMRGNEITPAFWSMGVAVTKAGRDAARILIRSRVKGMVSCMLKVDVVDVRYRDVTGKGRCENIEDQPMKIKKGEVPAWQK